MLAARWRPSAANIKSSRNGATLPYICRMTGEGEVTLWKRADRLLFAALPAAHTPQMLDTFRTVFGALEPATSVLETSLSNLNAVMHPGAMVLNAGWIEHTGGDFRFSEGTTPAVGRVIAATDAERLAIGARLDLSLVSFMDTFYASGYTTEGAWRSGEVYRAIKDGAGRATDPLPRRAPPPLHR